MTGLIVAAIIIGLIVIVGAAALFMLLPIILAFVGFLTLLGIVMVAAVLLLPNFLTLDQFKPQILSTLQQATGREITIGGPIGFTVWPVLGLQLNDISVGNPEGMRDPIMLAAKEVGVGVTLSSLMEHRLEIREVRIVGAQINLVADRSGKSNWVFKSRDVIEQPAEAPAVDNKQSEAESFAIKDVNVQSIAIKNSEISYEKAGNILADVQKLDLQFSMPSLDAAAKLNGSFVLRDRTVSFKGDLARPRSVMEGKPSAIALTLALGGDTAEIKGDIADYRYSGALDVSVGDLGKLAGWATGKPATLPVKTLALTSKLSADATQADLKGMVLKLDDMSVAGAAGVNWSGSRPRVTADVDVSALNLDKFMNSPTQSSVEGAPVTEAQPDLSGLNAVNADVTARLAGLTVKNMTLGATTAKIMLTSGKLQTTLSPASFYDGKVSAKADVSADTRSFSANAVLDGVNVESVLTALNGSSRLSGKGDFTVSVSGPVSTPEAIKRALNGSGRFIFRDGAIKGVNIPALVRRAKSMLGATDTAAADGPQQTDFTELTGSFTIADGLVRNNDLKMLSPLVRVGGKGTFNLPDQMVNYRVDSALVADLSGQGGVMERKGLVIPINVKGPVGNLSYTPDVQGLVLGNIGNAKDVGATIQNLGTKEGQRNTRNAIKDLLGIQRPAATTGTAPAADSTTSVPASPAPAAPPAQPAAPKPADLLNNLLNSR